MSLKDNSVFFTDYEEESSYSLTNQFAEHLEFVLVKDKITATIDDMYSALAKSIRDRLVRKWLRTQQIYKEQDVKRVYYLSLEFLMGRLMGNALINMDYYDECHKILKENGYNLEDIRDREKDMGLGNGGLGRLAACYLDSMATLGLPAFGYGIRYEFGIFKQEIVKGYQIERPDNWLSYGNPWEILRRELNYRVKFYGKVERWIDEKGTARVRWIDTEDILAVAYDVPVPGYRNKTVNNLRLWQAKSTEEFNFSEFNSGNYIASVENKVKSENISKVLYPNDVTPEGKMLRLKQQYFFVSATLHDILRKYRINHKTYDKFAEKTSIQLNDTHPVLAIPELMRILIDEEKLSRDLAWKITTETFSYTNHTVVPEALEEWPVSYLEEMLPRHLEIIYEINYRFLEEIRAKYTSDDSVISKLSIIKEYPIKSVRMANLAIVSSHKVNGVAALHTEIIKNIIFKEFNSIYPDKFINITNGITPRRWLKKANPFLSLLITERIGDKWIKDLNQLRKIEKFASDKEFLELWRNSKYHNKLLLIKHIENEHNLKIDPDSIFDVQVKRFHEYKRQLLNVLHVITLYNRIKDTPGLDAPSRAIIFGGKSAPGYLMSKLIIKLINNVAQIVNNDKLVSEKLKVIFIKNYSVSLAERIIPAADLSEQISTAGFEASGTGNMKFALNGALTIGTMDGANVEIREEVGDENIFIFGLLADEVINLKKRGYNPREYYENNQELKRAIDMISNNYFSRYEPGIFNPIVNNLLNLDYYCLCADYQSYIEAQDKVANIYTRPYEWAKKCVYNVARSGKFSSDRSVMEYSEKIWKVKNIEINS